MSPESYLVIVAFGRVKLVQASVSSSVVGSEIAAMARKKCARLSRGEHTVILVLFVELPLLEILFASEAQIHDVQRYLVREEMASVEQHVGEVKLAVGVLAFERLKLVVVGVHWSAHFVNPDSLQDRDQLANLVGRAQQNGGRSRWTRGRSRWVNRT